MTSDNCTYLCNHHPNQDTDISIPQSSFVPLYSQPLSPPVPQITNHLFSIIVDGSLLSIENFIWMKSLQCLSTFTQQNVCESHPCYCISNLLLFVLEWYSLYKYAIIYLSIHPQTRQLGCFQFWLLWRNLLGTFPFFLWEYVFISTEWITMAGISGSDVRACWNIRKCGTIFQSCCTNLDSTVMNESSSCSTSWQPLAWVFYFSHFSGH